MIEMVYFHARCMSCAHFEYWRKEPCSLYKPNDMKLKCRDWEDFVSRDKGKIRTK